MDWFDRSILEYVLAWAPHDSMSDEDTFPRFGMTVDQLRERFSWIVATSSNAIGLLDGGDRELMARARSHHLRTHPPWVSFDDDSNSKNFTARSTVVRQTGTDWIRLQSVSVPGMAGRSRGQWRAAARARQMAAVAAHAAAQRAGDVAIVDVAAQSEITDCFVVAFGEDDAPVRAIVIDVETQMGLAGYRPNWRDVALAGRWMLLDYIDIVVHVQHRSERNCLEPQQLWRDGPVTPVRLRKSAL